MYWPLGRYSALSNIQQLHLIRTFGILYRHNFFSYQTILENNWCFQFGGKTNCVVTYNKLYQQILKPFILHFFYKNVYKKKLNKVIFLLLFVLISFLFIPPKGVLSCNFILNTLYIKEKIKNFPIEK